MTVFGSIFTRPRIDRHWFATQYLTISRLPCSAATIIVHSFHSHFFSSRIHLSNSSLFVSATREQKYGSSSLPLLGHNVPPILPRNFQSRYRRHLFNPKRLIQIIRARGSLNQLSRLWYSLHTSIFKHQFDSSRKTVFETNIVVIHDHLPQRQRILSSPITTCSRFDKIDRGRRRLNRAQRKGRRRRRRRKGRIPACDFNGAFSKAFMGRKKLHCTEQKQYRNPR